MLLYTGIATKLQIPSHSPTPTETPTYAQTHTLHTIYINNKYKIILYGSLDWYIKLYGLVMLLKIVWRGLDFGYGAGLVWDGNEMYVSFQYIHSEMSENNISEIRNP